MAKSLLGISILPSLILAALIQETQPRQGTPPCVNGDDVVYCPATQELFVPDALDRLVRVDLTQRRVTWELQLPSAISSNIGVTRAVVAFALGPNEIWGVSRATGQQVWKLDNIRSKQLLALRDQLVVQTSDREGAIGVDAASGNILWRHSARAGTVPRFLTLFTAFGTSVLTDAFAINGATGQIINRWPVPVVAATFVGDRIVVATSATTLDSFGQEGKEQWSTRLPTDGLKQPQISMLAGDDGGALALVSRWPGQYGPARLVFASAAGRVLWQRDVARDETSVVGRMAIAAGCALVLTKATENSPDRTFAAVDLKTGMARWTVAVPERVSHVPRLGCGDAHCYLIGHENGKQVVLELDIVRGEVRRVLEIQSGLSDTPKALNRSRNRLAEK